MFLLLGIADKQAQCKTECKTPEDILHPQNIVRNICKCNSGTGGTGGHCDDPDALLFLSHGTYLIKFHYS